VENVFELLPAVRAGKAPALRELAPWVPAEVAAVVRRALAVDPDARYPTAAAMLDAIRALVPGGLALREETLAGVSPEARAAAASQAGDGRHGTSSSGTAEVSSAEALGAPAPQGANVRWPLVRQDLLPRGREPAGHRRAAHAHGGRELLERRSLDEVHAKQIPLRGRRRGDDRVRRRPHVERPRARRGLTPPNFL
jgi:hypothetical protein